VKIVGHKNPVRTIDFSFSRALHKGRIVEQSSHDELLHRQGVYRKLYEFQYAQ
jgi:ABC-type multidrug transport system fused ATPase/permease subunit